MGGDQGRAAGEVGSEAAGDSGERAEHVVGGPEHLAVGDGGGLLGGVETYPRGHLHCLQ